MNRVVDVTTEPCGAVLRLIDHDIKRSVVCELDEGHDGYHAVNDFFWMAYP